MTFMNVNSKNIVQRTLGLLLLLLLLAVDGVALKIVPTEAGAVYAVVSLTLLAVACVVAGYFLRTFWALLIVPIVFLGSAFLFGVFTISTKPDLFFFEIIFLFNVMISIFIALLALLGVLLGKRSARRRSARTGAAIAVS
jgi:hypothetical protein